MITKSQFSFEQEQMSQPFYTNIIGMEFKADEALEASQKSFEYRYYTEYIRIYKISHRLALEQQRQAQCHQELVERIKAVEQLMQDSKRQEQLRNEITSEEEARRKRARRTAEEIQKKHQCQVKYCEKLYGSEGSLQQHIKLKHPTLLPHLVQDNKLQYA